MGLSLHHLSSPLHPHPCRVPQVLLLSSHLLRRLLEDVLQQIRAKLSGALGNQDPTSHGTKFFSCFTLFLISSMSSHLAKTVGPLASAGMNVTVGPLGGGGADG